MRKLTNIEKENLAFLDSRHIPNGVFVPTPTGLDKDIVDATAEFREFLRLNGIFDFDTQESAYFNVRLVAEAGVSFADEARFYRPNRGDRRMRFSSLDEIASAWDAIAVLWVGRAMWLLNISRVPIAARTRAYPSDLRNSLEPDVLAWEVEDAATLVELSAGNSRYSKPQTQDPETRKIIELRAIELATEFLEANDFVVRDVGATESYDLDAVRGSEHLFVEVKGTVSPGSRVVLTRNEVELHRTKYPNNMLVVVSNIEMRRETGFPSAYGGDLNYWSPWDVQPEALEVIAYTYDVPEATAAPA